MKAPIIIATEQYVTNLLQKELTDDYKYHNLEHTQMVAKATRLISLEMGLPKKEREILEIAAWFHDTGFTRVYMGHEQESNSIARAFLEEKDYPEKKIIQVEDCINATQKDYEPQTILQKILKDADFNNLNGKSYKQKAKALQHEWSLFLGENYTKKEFLEGNIVFWNAHKFYTEEGKALFGPAVAKNLKKLTEKLEETKKKDMSNTKKEKRVIKENNGILATKSAQMMFKTTLRNHIDLTSIADNKANIMLSINALIITVTMPLLLSNIDGNKILMIPTFILLLTCTLSIIFATLATRPVPTNGLTNIDKVGKGVTNLFFYGNFWRMPLDQYKSGLEKVATNDAILDDTVVNDLYFLGKALGRKFHQLRICYSIFMVGMVLTVISYVIASSSSM